MEDLRNCIERVAKNMKTKLMRTYNEKRKWLNYRHRIIRRLENKNEISILVYLTRQMKWNNCNGVYIENLY